MFLDDLCIPVIKNYFTLRNFVYLFSLLWYKIPTQARAASSLRFLDHTQLHNTVVKTPLDEGSPRFTDLYLTTQNTDNRQACMSHAGYERAIPACDWLQTVTVDRSASGIGEILYMGRYNLFVRFLLYNSSSDTCFWLRAFAKYPLQTSCKRKPTVQTL